MTGYEKIKQLAKVHRCNIPDLLVLARQNDPFFAGSNTCKTMAEWFAELWQRFDYTTGVHLRRVHYQLVSQEVAKKHNGLPYENTENDWTYLCNAGKYARYLGLVDPTAFVDRRNPEPHIFAFGHVFNSPSWNARFPEWYLPKIHTDLTFVLNWELPDFEVEGYDYSEALQPYHLEVWVEKSTMDDVLIPICRQYGVNLVTGLGFMSITSVIDLLKRVTSAGKPGRIFYVSDLDPAGDGMPTAVARQIEYWLNTNALGLDMKLNPIVLTQDQVVAYRLPRIPVKDSDRRKANFEEHHGEGAVELDALEALHPGELARIVEEHILQFRDTELEDELDEAREEAEEELQEVWEERIEPYQEQLDALKQRMEPITEKYQARLKELSKEMEGELAPYQEKLNSLRYAIQNELDSTNPDLPDLPEPEVEPDDDGWLFDSSRDYFEQLAVYKARKNGKEAA